MEGKGIKFLPLYWIYHDNWINRTWYYDSYWGVWNPSETSRHMGHLHFFMPGYEIKNKALTGQAYTGKQLYTFALKSIWGPGSGDINQTNSVRYIGSPKWFFNINEYWRRVYIQPWDDKSGNQNIQSIVGKKGIKYDASHAKHTYGPFREGQGFFFYWNKSARTLPIEYYLDEKKRSRNNYLAGPEPWYLPININYYESNSDSISIYMKKEYVPKVTPFFIPNGDNNDGYVDRPMSYRMNCESYNGEEYYSKYRDEDITKEEFDKWSNIAKEIGATFTLDKNGKTVIKYCDDGYHIYNSSNSKSSWATPFGAFNVSCSDARYIYPIIEYQRVNHLNWERTPGWAVRDRDMGGDGFEIELSLPYAVDNEIQSPFSGKNKKVLPMGEYCHDFDRKFNNLVPRYSYYDKVDENNYQWVIVRRNNDGYDNITEEFVKTVVSEKKPEDSDALGEYVATQEPWPNGYVNDDKGRPVFFKRYDIKTEEYRIPNHWKDKVMSFNVPEGMKEDGVWVEQCFGGVVRAKAVITIEDNFGERKEVEIETTRFYLAEQFEGSDQNEPAEY